MKSTDRNLVGGLRELHLLLSVEPVMPEGRSISSWQVFQQRTLHASVVQQAIDRLVDEE